MSAPFVELSIDLLNESTYVGEINAKLQEAVQAVLDYRAKYGDFARTAKATVKMQIDIVCAPRDAEPGQRREASWMVTTKPIEVAKPKEHAKSSVPVCAEGEDGKLKLFVQRSGSRRESPRQGRLTTDDGRAVDPKTGEISPTLTQHIGGKGAA
jgi:hypothetical protein